MTFNRITSAALATLLLCSAASAAHAAPPGAVKNIVLVHGAFADGSGWRAVAEILRRDGYTVSVAQPPETSFADDVAATNRVLDQQDGPAVLVGHSYGGAVISEAGNNTHAKTLVYVAAFQPDAGESAAMLAQKIPPAGTAIRPTPDGYLVLDPAGFREDFAADLPKAETDFMAISQVPVALKSIGGVITTAAWRTKPSFAIVATQDRAINPDLERFMYKRAGSTVTEIVSSHAAYMSQPLAVARVIERAAGGAR